MNTVLGPNVQPAPPSLLPQPPKVNIFTTCQAASVLRLSLLLFQVRKRHWDPAACTRPHGQRAVHTPHVMRQPFCFYVVDTVDQLQSSLDHFMICLRRLLLCFKFFRNAFTLKLNTRNVSLVPNGWYNYLQTLSLSSPASLLSLSLSLSTLALSSAFQGNNSSSTALPLLLTAGAVCSHHLIRLIHCQYPTRLPQS